MQNLYTAKATSTGGRNGHVKSSNGLLDIDMRTPKEMGGPSGDYLNPEMLFAAGYAACFDSALDGTIKTEKVQTGTTSVTGEVSIGKLDNGGYGLAVILRIEIPGIDKQKAEELANKAHQVCPYSNATRGNIEVQLIIQEVAALAVS
jgi:Ohr subfamily peroxiredoxin